MKNFGRWLAIYGIYFLFLSLAHWSLGFRLLGLWVGAVLGWLFPYFERLLYVYYVRPHEQLSVQVKHLLASRRIVEVFRLVALRGQEQRLIGRSVVFLLLWVPLSLFVVTSTNSFVATGMVLGLGLQLVLWMLTIRGDWERLTHGLFWPVQREVGVTEMVWVVRGFIVFFTFVSLLVFI